MHCWLELSSARVSNPRRLVLVLIAMTASAIALRPLLAWGLINRGDEMLYEGNSSRALTFYEYALALDHRDAVAADRYVFVSMMFHNRSQLRRSIALATRFLASNAGNVTIRMDRALCEWRLRQARAAELDFATVARENDDARAFVFAGYAAAAAGSGVRARRWWRAAVALNHSYVPALRAMRRE